MFNPIEWIKKFIQELTHDFANMAFDGIALFMLKPTDFSDYPKIDFVYDFVFALAYGLSSVFIGMAIIGTWFHHLAGTQSRGLPEIISKAVLAYILSLSAPWILDNVLIKLNNVCVQYFLDKGLDTKALEKFITVPGTATVTFFAVMAVIVGLLVLLAYQYIVRLGEYIVLLVTSPIAAHSIISENLDIWSIWWREAISVVFSQALQVALLWLLLNSLTGTQKLFDYMIAIGLMSVLLRGPKYIRQFLYSSGGGRAAIGMAGGTSKAVLYKYMASRMTGK